MKRDDLQDLLCGDEGQPWPAEAQYDIEGLHYHELKKLCVMLERDESLPSYDELREIIREREANGFVLAGPGSDPKGASKAYPLLVKSARRKAMAQVLGVTEPSEAAALAREAGTALDRVVTAAKRVGVQLDLNQRGSRRELLEVATALYATMPIPRGPEGGQVAKERAATAIRDASLLIQAIDDLTESLRGIYPKTVQ